MNILYILGNGFDKAQGMATSYPEFYNYLMTNSDNCGDMLQLLKNEISDDKELWSDMEIAFGHFTSKIKNPEDFEELFFELNEYLQEYLKIEDSKFMPSTNLKSKFISDFLTPSKNLEPLDKQRFLDETKSFGTAKDLYVMTLNYTNTLEKLLSLNDKVVTKSFSNSETLRNIIHVHGRLDDSIIIGVDNETQIDNTDFRSNQDVRDLLIKEESNEAMKEIRHLTCKSYIDKANIINLYGVSLGKTDERWWKLIGDNLKSRKNLIIIQHLYVPNFIKPTQKQKIGKLEREHRQEIMQRMDIKHEELTKEIENRLFFTVNSNIFTI